MKAFLRDPNSKHGGAHHMLNVSNFPRRGFLLAAALLLSSQTVLAETMPCVNGTVASILGTICGIGDVLFDFTTVSTRGGPIDNNSHGALSAEDVQFIADNSNPLMPGFTLMANFGATPIDRTMGASQDFTLRYTIMPAMARVSVVGITNTLGPVTITGGNTGCDLENPGCAEAFLLGEQRYGTNLVGVAAFVNTAETLNPASVSIPFQFPQQETTFGDTEVRSVSFLGSFTVAYDSASTHVTSLWWYFLLLNL